MAEQQQQALVDLGEYIAATVSDAVVRTEVKLGELMVTIPRGMIVRVLNFLRDDPSCQFQMLMDVTAVDWPDRRLTGGNGLQRIV